jgi:hypothetical protein
MTSLSTLGGMEALRSTWTDSRLDDLNGRVGGMADEVKELRKDVRELRGEFGALQRTLLQMGGGLIGTLLIGMLGLIGTQL